MRFYFKIEKCVVVVKSDSAYLTIMMQHALCINLSRTGIQSGFSFKFEFNIDAWRSGGMLELISKWAWSKGPSPPLHALIEGISSIRGQWARHNAYKKGM
jgi:hypothetical protein